jgi:DNA polymerase III epsilon subunit-like protein
MKEITINEIFKLLDSKNKLLFIGTTLSSYSNLSKLYYLLKNSYHNPNIFASETITYDKRNKTRIRGNIKVNNIQFIREQCIFVYYENITQPMLKDRKLILTDCMINIHNKLRLEPIITKLKKQYKIDYEYSEKITIDKHLKLESYDENYLFRLNKHKRSTIKEPKYLVFDTETNGLPKMIDYRCVRFDHYCGWDDCRLISIGWILTDHNFNEIRSDHYLIKNNTIFNSVYSQNINKITDEERELYGVVFNDVIDKFIKDVEECDYIVCHGSDFDFNLLIRECKLHDINIDILSSKQVLNTKQNLWKQNHKLGLSDIVTINNKLNLNSHNALYDSYLCLELLKIRLSI